MTRRFFSKSTQTCPERPDRRRDTYWILTSQHANVVSPSSLYKSMNDVLHVKVSGMCKSSACVTVSPVSELRGAKTCCPAHGPVPRPRSVTSTHQTIIIMLSCCRLPASPAISLSVRALGAHAFT